MPRRLLHRAQPLPDHIPSLAAAPLPSEQDTDAPPAGESGIGRRALLGGAAILGGVALAATAGDLAQPSTAHAQLNPPPALSANRFSITIDGYEIASFSELMGITTEVEPVDYLESTDKEVILKKLPGRSKPPTLVLRRGKTNSLEVWAWHEAVLMGDIIAARKSCSLTMFAVDGKPVARYFLEHAWPSKIEIGALKAGATDVLTEIVTFVAERIQRVSA